MIRPTAQQTFYNMQRKHIIQSPPLPASAAGSGQDNRVIHDPVTAGKGGPYYLFSTGNRKTASSPETQAGRRIFYATMAGFICTTRCPLSGHERHRQQNAQSGLAGL